MQNRNLIFVTIWISDLDVVGLNNPLRIEQLQNQALKSLEDYDRQYYAQKPQRFPRMLLRLSSLRSISRECVGYILQNKQQGPFRVDEFILEMIDGDVPLGTPLSPPSSSYQQYYAPTPPGSYPMEGFASATYT